MNNIVSLFKKSPVIKEILTKIEQTNKYSYFVNGTTRPISYLMAYATFLSTNENVVFLTSNLYKANVAYGQLVNLAGIENVTLYVADDAVATEFIAVNSELKYERINALRAVIEEKPKIIVVDVQAALKPLMMKEDYKNAIINLAINDTIDVDKIIRKLVEGGYTKTPTTYAPGEFSVRGEVIDIYPITYLKPIRINLFDCDIESIREYNAETQKSEKKIDSITVYPLYELIINDITKVKNILNRHLTEDAKAIIKQDIADMENFQNNDRMFKYIKYLYADYQRFLDYLDSPIVLYDNLMEIKERHEQVVTETYQYTVDKGLRTIDLLFYDDYDRIENDISKKIYLSSLRKSVNKLELMGIYELDGYNVLYFDNNFKYLVEWLTEASRKKETVVLALSSPEKKEIIDMLLDENNIKYLSSDIFDIKQGTITTTVSSNAIGYGLLGEVTVFSDEEIFQKGTKRVKYRSVIQSINSYNTKDDLEVGDYVVHYDYGIGQYLGIKTVELNGIVKDYLQLKYLNVEVLVPVEKITLLEKYQGRDTTAPRLTKVGTNEWEKKKENVRGQLESIARELIEVQVQRKAAAGFTYEKDSELQKAFERDFEYVETKDQLRIVNEIKQDMESGKLIERLVCGDVGFGKTEIAMRIAFKTVYEGKQVAYLAPTTILTRQHFYSFKERFEKYGIQVEMLNRLVSLNDQKRILLGLKEGNINIVIGTHRLLSKDVVFKDLGLLVVDEEQRFGVTHKESIKKLKTNVNVLTLSATPIPRTLQMAVSGLRQLSVIETPPSDRYPIQTYVMEHNWVMVKEAIYRELNRGGQVFYLHNRISDVEKVAKKISEIVPEARICIGHGQMDKDHLEDTIQAFIDQEFDVLVCTTIIETGIDIPNTNTLIIDDANRLGLAQMYQVRGRVGRSDKIAYAYLTYPPHKVLTKTGTQRLEAITEYTKIGSGYKIAVRDLVIRGAGDILGREQSGFIDTVGMDMYMRLLDEAIKKIQGVEEVEKTHYKIEVNKHVKNDYVSDDAIKIYIHQMINNINTLEKKDEVKSELQDRFGRLSDDILLYIEEIYLESILRSFKVLFVNENDYSVKIMIPADVSKNIKGEELVMCGYRISERFTFEYRNHQIIINIKKKQKNDKTWIYLLTQLLEKMTKFLV